MKIVTSMTPQGDLLLRRLDALPSNVHLEEVAPSPEGHILAHSETGHHHVVEEPLVRWLKPKTSLDNAGNFGASMVSYLQVLADHADVLHKREEHRHETLRLPKGIYEVRRQREHSPVENVQMDAPRASNLSWRLAQD